ncbi:methionyl-tRNA formyltransferase [Marinivivus vitaminiproducens]|uniref:methionyl-tRNA formyltransferase n=1 Tax=Marinivivus vitaminiproducens TaxID=3035935 RepID=UPI0027986E7A|nr:methionyl-tRNA formyltransferase [Geminicoccaceae bacterium SCSIO 64248]
MRIVFMGTTSFAVAMLDAVTGAGHEVVAVYSQPPRKAGRGHKVQPSPVHQRALAEKVEVRTPLSLREADAQDAFAALRPDLAVVAAYGLILPGAVLDAPRLGCLNVHASLLPRWRGAAPIQRAIEAGDAVTGISLMRMDAGLDTGGVYRMAELPIGPDATGGALHDELARLGADMLPGLIDDLAAGRAAARPQPAEGVTYAAKIDRAESRIDWDRPADAIVRRVRAFEPAPGSWTEMDGLRLRVREAVPAAGEGPPGTVLDDRLTVACGRDAVRLVRVQRPGRDAVDAAAFLRGRAVAPGTVLA